MSAHELDQKLIDFWLQGASDLRIRVTAPFGYELDDGSLVYCEAKVHDFASPDGALCLSQATERRLGTLLRGQKTPAWCSIFPRVKYSQRYCKDTLDDWGWYGEPDKAPEWYTGRYWS